MGDAALLIELGMEIDEELNARVHALTAALADSVGIVEIIPAYASLLIQFDPVRISDARLSEQLQALTERLDTTTTVPSAPRIVEIPTHYGGEYGPDLEFVAQHNYLSPQAVIRHHTAQTYRVFMIGFAPGFPYLGILPSEIAAPRLDTPRPKIPAGSVGIAGRQTGIYPRESPGGWRLIGRTDVKLFDPSQNPPTRLRPGDLVQFVAL
jgi:KipI family sensor histidine kinase inhibitor